MAVIADKQHHYKTIERTCYYANILYLVLHLFYLVLFICNKYWILVGVMGVAVAAYIAFFYLIHIKKYYLYALICGNLYFVVVSMCTINLGFATGFHFYLIGLCVTSFFTTYFSKKRDIRGSILWAGLSLTLYLVLYLVTEFNPPHYPVPRWMEVTLFIIHAIVVFMFIVLYLLVFIRYTMSLEKKIMNESRTDELTQINNRYGLYDYFSLAEDKSNNVLALFDIDDFKGVNDKHGHVMGDYILKRVAEIAHEVLPDDFVCRYGGEEFVIVIKHNENQSFFYKLERLRLAVEAEEFEFENVKLNVTITIGAVAYDESYSLEKWVELADEKMYYGKKTGKNKTVI